jgi:hypothetical protein
MFLLIEDFVWLVFLRIFLWLIVFWVWMMLIIFFLAFSFNVVSHLNNNKWETVRDKIFFHFYNIIKQKKCKAIIVLPLFKIRQSSFSLIKTMLTSKKKKDTQFYESSNQIYISDFIGLQRTQRAQVVYFRNQSILPWDILLFNYHLRCIQRKMKVIYRYIDIKGHNWLSSNNSSSIGGFFQVLITF